MIYLDYSANTPASPAALKRFVETESRFIGNPNSRHSAGEAARAEMNKITASVAKSLGAGPEEIIFTSGASEANNLALKGIARAARHAGRHIISTPLEHSSVSGCLTALQEQGWEIDLVDIDRRGRVDLGHLSELMRKDTVLVAVCAVDSELGTVQPIAEIADIVEKYPNCSLHVDATQAIGKIPVSLKGVSTMSLSSHKIYGLNGCGLLFKRQELAIEPLIHGGLSSTLYRSGTPALALAASTDTAVSDALSGLEVNFARVKELNTELRRRLAAYPKVRFNSPEDAVPHILNLSVGTVKGGEFQKALDKYGVCVSVKSACSVENTPSRAVFAVSRDRKNALASWRISLSHFTERDELDKFMEIFDKCYKELVP